VSAAAAREKLKAVLDPADRYNSYWDALTQFLRLELSKAEFDRIAVGALGAHVALHNDLIMALLRDAQRGPPPELPFKTEPMVVGDSASSAPLAGTEVSVPESAPAPKLQGEGEAASSLVAAGAAPAMPSAPKLMLKIKADGGGNLAASLQEPAVNVDPQEEEQLNALYDRLLEIAKDRGLQGAAPQAVSFMARAVRATTNHLVTAAVLHAADHSGVAQQQQQQPAPTDDATKRMVSASDLADCIRQTTRAPWMVPPSQRAGLSLLGGAKFVA